MQAFTRWKCDTCGQWIEGADKGYVVWGDKDGAATGFRVIHNGKCDDGALGKSAALGDFLGTDGLAKLTSLMSYGIARRRQEQPKIHDMDQFTDFFRRMQLPLYEEARDYLKSPEGREEYSDASEVLPYLQRSLERDATRS